MDFSLDDDHRALQDAVRRFCDGEYAPQERGNPESPEIARRRWSGLAALGVLGLGLDPELGGSGQGTVEAMLVAQELGRALAGGDWLPCAALAAQLLADVGSPAQCSRWLPQVASGQARLALAHAEDESRHALQHCTTRVRKVGENLRLDGHKALVLGGEAADAFIVLARSAGDVRDAQGLTLLIVDAHAPGITVCGFSTLDGRRAARVVFDDVEVAHDAVVGIAGKALACLDKAVDRAAALSCAEAAGAIDALIGMTVEHLLTRTQFGAPLARLQVLQHRLADMVIAREQVVSMAAAAAMGVDSADAAERRRLVSAAKVVTAQAARQVAHDAIQMHGAMGMTDECRVGHYAKRLLVIRQLFGDAAHHLQRLADQPQS